MSIFGNRSRVKSTHIIAKQSLRVESDDGSSVFTVDKPTSTLQSNLGTTILNNTVKLGTDLEIKDNIIEINTDTKDADIGLALKYSNSGTKYAGLYRDNISGQFVLYKEIIPKPQSNIDITSSNLADLNTNEIFTKDFSVLNKMKKIDEKNNTYEISIPNKAGTMAMISDIQSYAQHDQELNTTNSVIFAGLTVNGNITTSGTTDGVDLSAFKTAYDTHKTDYDSKINQELKTTSAPIFSSMQIKNGTNVMASFATSGALTTTTITAGTNAIAVGALSATSITSSGTMSCGTNAITGGILNCSSIIDSGTLSCAGMSCGSNSLTCGSISSGSIAINPTWARLRSNISLGVGGSKWFIIDLTGTECDKFELRGWIISQNNGFLLSIDSVELVARSRDKFNAHFRLQPDINNNSNIPPYISQLATVVLSQTDLIDGIADKILIGIKIYQPDGNNNINIDIRKISGRNLIIPTLLPLSYATLDIIPTDPYTDGLARTLSYKTSSIFSLSSGAYEWNTYDYEHAGTVKICRALTTGAINAGTNAITGGTLNCSSIIDSGSLSCTTLTTTGAINAGTNALTSGALNCSSSIDSGTLNAVSISCGSIDSVT